MLLPFGGTSACCWGPLSFIRHTMAQPLHRLEGLGAPSLWPLCLPEAFANTALTDTVGPQHLPEIRTGLQRRSVLTWRLLLKSQENKHSHSTSQLKYLLWEHQGRNSERERDTSLREE